MGFILLLIAIVAVIVLFKKSEDKVGVHIPQIHQCNSVRDVVMSVNHARIYPFFTRMNFERAKKFAMQIHPNKVEFEQELQLRELMGMKSYLDVPVQNKYIERIFMTFSKSGLVSSIGIDIRNFDVNMTELMNEMVVKFGRPFSMDNEFIIWREGPMVINICKEGSVSVIDESLFGR